MKQTLIVPILTVAALSLVSCENPADQTTDAEVGEKQEKVADPGEGGEKWTFTGNSKIGFIGSKVTGQHEGGFQSFTGHFTLNEGKPVGNDHKVIIDMNSIWSDNEKLTGHLKDEDFFDVPKYPETTFDVTAIENVSGQEYSVTGNLTMHGVTKSVTFPATVTEVTDDTARIQAEFDINRFDWNMEFKGKPDDLIRKEVVIKLDLEAEKQ